MWEHEKGCQKAVGTLNIKTSIFILQYLSHFCIEHEQKRWNTYLSNDILYTFVSYILSEILLIKIVWYCGLVVITLS